MDRMTGCALGTQISTASSKLQYCNKLPLKKSMHPLGRIYLRSGGAIEVRPVVMDGYLYWYQGEYTLQPRSGGAIAVRPVVVDAQLYQDVMCQGKYTLSTTTKSTSSKIINRSSTVTGSLAVKPAVMDEYLCQHQDKYTDLAEKQGSNRRSTRRSGRVPLLGKHVLG